MSISLQVEPMKRYEDSDLFTVSLQNDDVQDFDVRWDQALLSASENALRYDPGRIVQVKIGQFCSTSDSDVFVRLRNCSEQWTNKLFTIEDGSKTSC